MRRLPAAIYLHLKTVKLRRLLPPFWYGKYPLCEPLDTERNCLFEKPKVPGMHTEMFPCRTVFVLFVPTIISGALKTLDHLTCNISEKHKRLVCTVAVFEMTITRLADIHSFNY